MCACVRGVLNKVFLCPLIQAINPQVYNPLIMPPKWSPFTLIIGYAAELGLKNVSLVPVVNQVHIS